MDSLQPRFVDARPMTIVGLDQSYEMPDAPQLIPAQWTKLFDQQQTIPSPVGSVCYGISHDVEGCRFDYLAGVEVLGEEPIPEGLASIHLPAQRYAAFVHEGHVSELSKTIQFIWTEWLPQSGKQPGPVPLVIERYGESFDPHRGMGDLEVWIPIRE